MKHKRILVIGNGYIGQSLSSHLAFGNTTVDTCDIGWYGNGSYACDYKDLKESTIKSYDCIVLLAGHSSVGMCLNNHLPTFNNNIHNFVNLLYKMDKKNQTLIFASSGSLASGFVGAKESDIAKEFNNEYDYSKAEIEKHAAFWGGRYFALRFGTVNGLFGGRQVRTDIMINSFVNSFKEEGVIKIANGGISRSILGMKDLVHAVEVIIRDDSAVPGIYNLASFSGRVREIALDCAAALKCGITDQGDKGAPYNFSLDTSKFSDTFRFKFCDTPQTICKDLINNWYPVVKSDRYKVRKYE